jgi:hypothetical protein
MKRRFEQTRMNRMIKIKRLVFFAALLLLACLPQSYHAQNTIAVPFDNGFVGDNTGNNSSGNCYYHSGAQGLGWTDVQFTQTTNGNVFVAQGNDIIGSVLITDNSGIVHEIPGFIKWRTPSGNNPHTMVFQPGVGTYSLATNGYNGSSTYTIDENKYIGLTKLGSTLSISPVPGTVTGNASTSGLLDALNDILGDMPQLTITGTTVNESDGVADVTIDLSKTSTVDVTISFVTISNTAVSVDDYDSTFSTLTFSPGDLQKTVSIPITVDMEGELSEFFVARLFEPINGALVVSTDSVWILDTALPVVFAGISAECDNNAVTLSWETATEYQSSHYEIERSTDGSNWNFLDMISAVGNSDNMSYYTFRDKERCLGCKRYYRVKQVDIDGASTYFPTVTAFCSGESEDVLFYPNPVSDVLTVSLKSSWGNVESFKIVDVSGKIVFDSNNFNGSTVNNTRLSVLDFQNGVYTLLIQTASHLSSEVLVVQH